jgi:hypothetical protein
MRKIMFEVQNDELSNSKILYIVLNNKEIALENEDGFMTWELKEPILLKLLEMAMLDKEYQKYLEEMPDRIAKLKEEE